jgi:hypothetical protein
MNIESSDCGKRVAQACSAWFYLVLLIIGHFFVGCKSKSLVIRGDRDGNFLSSASDLKYLGSLNGVFLVFDENGNLIELYSNGGFSDKDLQRLKIFDGLKALYLLGSDISDEGLLEIKGVEGLEALSISGATITDVSGSVISGFKQLKHLDISWTGVTSGIVPHLSGLTKLEVLNLDGLAISEANLQDLRASLINIEEFSSSHNRRVEE